MGRKPKLTPQQQQAAQRVAAATTSVTAQFHDWARDQIVMAEAPFLWKTVR